MKYLSLFLLFISLYSYSQKTYVPDNNFEQALINLGYDSAMDDSVLTTNINNVDTLIVGFNVIYDLTGIEDFSALEFLACNNNQLTNLDVTQNSALIHLSCFQNSLTSLDVTQNTALKNLYCFTNQLSTLDVSQNLLLEKLLCYSNNILNLNITNNLNLTDLECAYNQLTTLDISQNSQVKLLTCNYNSLTELNVMNNNNYNFSLFGATNNPNLSCIQVDDSAYSTNNWNNIDTHHFFSESCATSINEYNKNDWLNIHPNPVKTDLNITISNKNNNQEITMLLTNINGIVVLQKSLLTSSNIIDITDISKGFYTLTILKNSTILAAEKLIITN